MKDAITIKYDSAIAVSAETAEAIAKLPAKLRKLATEITESNNKARMDAASTLANIDAQAAELAKETAKRVHTLCKSYDMKADKNAPYKSWGDFAKAAWNRSPAWVTQNCGVAAVLLNDKDENAKAVASDYNFTQIAEMLPLCNNGKLDEKLVNAINDEEIKPDMTASAIRQVVKALRNNCVEDTGTKVDILYPASGNRVDGATMKAEAKESNDERLCISFNPEYKDHDGTPWKALMYLDRATLSPEIVLYHKHKEQKSTESNVKHLDETDRLAISIREMPEKFRAAIVAEYKESKSIDYAKLCKLVGVEA